jgi:hypothetical protein
MEHRFVGKERLEALHIAIFHDAVPGFDRI